MTISPQTIRKVAEAIEFPAWEKDGFSYEMSNPSQRKEHYEGLAQAAINAFLCSDEMRGLVRSLERMLLEVQFMAENEVIHPETLDDIIFTEARKSLLPFTKTNGDV